MKPYFLKNGKQREGDRSEVLGATVLGLRVLSRGVNVSLRVRVVQRPVLFILLFFVFSCFLFFVWRFWRSGARVVCANISSPARFPFFFLMLWLPVLTAIGAPVLGAPPSSSLRKRPQLNAPRLCLCPMEWGQPLRPPCGLAQINAPLVLPNAIGAPVLSAPPARAACECPPA